MYKENDQSSHCDNRSKSRIVSHGLDVNGAENDGFSSSEGNLTYSYCTKYTPYEFAAQFATMVKRGV